MKRCQWAEKEVFHSYHDTEWCKPVHDDKVLFEFLILEGAQAGLSWETILKRREGYRKAFCGFDVSKVARLTDQQLEKILLDPGVIRNRLKVYGARTNACAFLSVQKEFGSFDAYLWKFVGGKVKVNSFKSLKEIPATTPESDALSKDLKMRGFTFVGSTICYAFMQAVGMVNDHEVGCSFR